MNARSGCLLVTLLVAAACGGGAVQDVLAPIPTPVDAELVEPAPLRVEWTVKAALDQDQEPEVPTRGAALDAALAYFVYGARLDARQVSDGELAWRLEADDEIVLAPVPVADGVALATARGWLWVDRAGRLQGQVPHTTAPLDAVGGSQGVFQVNGGEVSRIARGPDGQVAMLWTTAVQGALAVALDPGQSTVLVVSAAGQVTALSATAGVRHWTSTAVEAITERPAVTANRAYVVGQDQRVHGLDLRDGDRVWLSKNIGIRTSGVPAVVDRVVWVAGMDAALHGFGEPAGSHLFRIPISSRAYVNPVAWGRWLVASPQSGPWTLVRAPLFRTGPADPGLPRTYTIPSDGDLELAPGVGPEGLALVDAAGTMRLLLPPPWARAAGTATAPRER